MKKLRRFWYRIRYRIRNTPSDIRAWFDNGFVNRTHLVRVKAMKFGQWYDLDYKLFHANFQMLVDFVEKELAINSSARKYGREQGLAKLDWEIDLVNDLSMEGWEREACKAQSEKAKLVKELYLWYTDVYPNRPDPWDAIVEKYPDANRKFGLPDAQGSVEWLVKDESVEKEYSEMLEAAWDQEQRYDEEDTEKLIALIKLRHSLWT